MSSKATLRQRQLDWARKMGIASDAKGYVKSLNANLWRPLSPDVLKAFQEASGQELGGKMMALHSSSALAVNFFEYWSSTDQTALKQVLALDSDVEAIRFEVKFPTGLRGSPPNLDVCITLKSGHTVAIESKFSEWLSRKSQGKPLLKPKYFENGATLWASQGLAACQALANDVRDGKEKFEHFDVAQMLKHALGLATKLKSDFSLWYAYYEFEGLGSNVHRAEVKRFNERVGAEIRFKAMTYRDVFRRLRANGKGPPAIERWSVNQLLRREEIASFEIAHVRRIQSVAIAQSVAEGILRPPLLVKRGAPLLYEIKVDNNLEVMDLERVRKPTRGSSAFQTDLCIFEERSADVLIPRVVIEFKTRITTHDVLTYSAKATKHKQIYPYLRYGIVASGERTVPGRVFTHNEGLDFFASVAGLEGRGLKAFLATLLTAEIASSRCLEGIAFGKVKTRLFRTEVLLSGSRRHK